MKTKKDILAMIEHYQDQDNQDGIAALNWVIALGKRGRKLGYKKIKPEVVNMAQELVNDSSGE